MTQAPLASMYFSVRNRVLATVTPLGDDQLVMSVPACPDWTVHGLLAHLVSMPMAIMDGEIPDEVLGGGDPNPWLRRLVDEHSRRPVDELAAWWAHDDERLAPVLQGAGLLLADLFTHEGDILGALGVPADRNTPELDSQIDAAMAGLQKDIARAGLPAIAVDNGTERRQSAPGDPGWVLRCDFWTAHRVFNSRRTRDELLALPHEGDPARYFAAMHAHLPLPEHSLGE
ncbi:MAG: hypothetical protein RIB98_12130 [Acidimicrobiales bacterium]